MNRVRLFGEAVLPMSCEGFQDRLSLTVLIFRTSFGFSFAVDDYAVAQRIFFFL